MASRISCLPLPLHVVLLWPLVRAFSDSDLLVPLSDPRKVARLMSFLIDLSSLPDFASSGIYG